MRIIKMNDTTEICYMVRHWGKWYVLMNDGGLVNISDWFKNADEKAEKGDSDVG